MAISKLVALKIRANFKNKALLIEIETQWVSLGMSVLKRSIAIYLLNVLRVFHNLLIMTFQRV